MHGKECLDQGRVSLVGLAVCSEAAAELSRGANERYKSIGSLFSPLRLQTRSISDVRTGLRTILSVPNIRIGNSVLVSLHVS